MTGRQLMSWLKNLPPKALDTQVLVLRDAFSDWTVGSVYFREEDFRIVVEPGPEDDGCQ